ncbi:MAG: hypothetical protein R3C11_13630 [Planctomycetaceae bacterium]
MKYLLFVLLLSCSGCLQPVDEPGIVPDPTNQVRRTIAESLQHADLQDCLKIYGIYMAAAEYIHSEQLQANTAAELYKQLQTMFELSNWPHGKHPAFTTA